MTCEKPEDCPAVVMMKNEITKTREDYQNAQQATIENTKEMQKTNIALVEMTGDVRHLCRDFKEYKSENEKEHGHFFTRIREQETQTIKDNGDLRTEFSNAIGNIKVTEATKLSTGDMLKLLSALGILFGIFFGIMRYAG